MHSRLEGFERRLAALHAVLRAWSGDEERKRRSRERSAMLASILRAGLESAGVDPGEASSLRHLEDPEWPPAFMRPLRFVHPLRRLAEKRRPRTVVEQLDDATRRYQQGPAPDLSQASVLQLIGYYCFGAGNKAGNKGGASREAPA